MKHSRIASLLVWLAVFCAFVGFLDATYLTANHLAQVVPPCTIDGGCERVLTSEFAHFGPIPLAAGGMVFYLTAVLFGVAYIDRKSRKALAWMLALATAGIAVSGVMVYIQLEVLHAVCLYCMASAISSLGFGACTLWAAIFHRNVPRTGVEPPKA